MKYNYNTVDIQSHECTLTHRREWTTGGNERMKLVIIDPRVPRAVNAKLLVRNHNHARVRVLARNLIVLGNVLEQLLRKVQHLVVERHILHR